MEVIGTIWNELLLRPMTNGLLLLAVFLFHNFGIGILALTVIVRLLTFPLTVRQLRQTKAMAELQPKLQAMQKQHGKDRQRLSQETMRMYKEAGVSPIGCLGPMLIQFPIWIALYYGLVRALPSNPESLVGLSSLLYSWATAVHTAIPFSSMFLGMDLAAQASQNSATQIVMPLLVGGSMWAMQKMSTYPNADPRQAQTNQIMLWMMPIMFAFFTLSFPNGLSLYWFISNVVGIVMQYFVTGWGGLATLWQRKPRPAPEAAVVSSEPAGESSSDGTTDRSERQNGRGSNRAGAKAARSKARRGRN